MFRFRRFSTRLVAMLLGLLFAAFAATYFFVSRANEATALKHSEANLEVGAGLFDETIRQRIEYLSGSGRLLSGDYAIRQTLNEDAATLSSALESYTRRVQSPVIALLDPEGKLLANSDATIENENVRPFRHLIGLAREKDPAEESGLAYLKEQLHVLVVVPIYAPAPEIVAWFGLAFPIDRAFAQKIKDPTHLEVTFVSTDDDVHPRVLASTLSEGDAKRVAQAVAANQALPVRIKTLQLQSERYVTLFQSRAMLAAAPITVVLQRSLSDELAAARELKAKILSISLAALAAATLVALWIARGVSQPVQQLAAHTRVIAAGDYDSRITVGRADELGQLADAMNTMSSGLAERDRVRDLLDKNVSPEVAAQLMRDGAALGGEEREVTILFADLRGFTTLSEKLEPRDLLTLLNRYLDRMSTEIERQGGVIDKFIGDAIMALFGAPVAQGNAADRALAAALAMERALVALNAELAAEAAAAALSPSNGPPRPNLPTSLAIGVGVNTARVVAGNIGSHRRLNYSVIGDGVNVAARLQSETRKAEHRANIITSAATLAACRSGAGILPVSADHGQDARATRFRPLGRVQVKGRAEPVEIFAVS